MNETIFVNGAIVEQTVDNGDGTGTAPRSTLDWHCRHRRTTHRSADPTATGTRPAGRPAKTSSQRSRRSSTNCSQHSEVAAMGDLASDRIAARQAAQTAATRLTVTPLMADTAKMSDEQVGKLTALFDVFDGDGHCHSDR